MVLAKESAPPKTMAMFYRAVVQAVFLYGSETWVTTSTMMKKLETFHHQAARGLTRRHIRPYPDNEGEWIIPPTKEVLEEAGLQTIDTYISNRRRRSQEKSE